MMKFRALIIFASATTAFGQVTTYRIAPGVGALLSFETATNIPLKDVTFTPVEAGWTVQWPAGTGTSGNMRSGHLLSLESKMRDDHTSIATAVDLSVNLSTWKSDQETANHEMMVTFQHSGGCRFFTRPSGGSDNHAQKQTELAAFDLTVKPEVWKIIAHDWDHARSNMNDKLHLRNTSTPKLLALLLSPMREEQLDSFFEANRNLADLVLFENVDRTEQNLSWLQQEPNVARVVTRAAALAGPTKSEEVQRWLRSVSTVAAPVEALPAATSTSHGSHPQVTLTDYLDHGCVKYKVKKTGQKDLIIRTYNQFRSLSWTLSYHKESSKLPKFPPSYWGRPQEYPSEKFTQRKEQLQAYLNAVVENATLAELDAVKDFFFIPS